VCFGGRVFAPGEPNGIERVKIDPCQKVKPEIDQSLLVSLRIKNHRRSNVLVSPTPMKTLILLRVALILILLELTASVGLCDSEVAVGSSGPVIAFRVNSFLGWTFKFRNDSDATYTAVFAINGRPDLKAVPAHRTVKAAFVLGREVPTFHFAPKIGELKRQTLIPVD